MLLNSPKGATVIIDEIILVVGLVGVIGEGHRWEIVRLLRRQDSNLICSIVHHRVEVEFAHWGSWWYSGAVSLDLKGTGIRRGTAKKPLDLLARDVDAMVGKG